MANQVPNENDHPSNCYIASLIINETKMEDEISYVLVVENREGKIEHSIRLNVCVITGQCLDASARRHSLLLVARTSGVSSQKTFRRF